MAHVIPFPIPYMLYNLWIVHGTPIIVISNLSSSKRYFDKVYYTTFFHATHFTKNIESEKGELISKRYWSLILSKWFQVVQKFIHTLVNYRNQLFEKAVLLLKVHINITLSM